MGSYLINPSPTPASTEDYSGSPATTQTTGTTQNSSWEDTNVAPITGEIQVLDSVPAQVKVSVTGSGVTQDPNAAPNQFRLTVSLAAETVQLTGHVNTAVNVNSDPSADSFTWVSRQSSVATVNSSGLVTLIGRGSTTLECRYNRAVNASFTNATPSGTEYAYATIDLTVTP